MLIALATDHAHVSVADLDADILRLERALSALRSQRELVLERLDSYKYPVLTLPNEITAEIFPFPAALPSSGLPLCPPFTGRDSPTLLTQVCCQWREIALETPILWRAILLSDFNIPPERRTHLCDRWLERSRCCPLSLHFDDEDPVRGGLHIAEILAAIVPHRARLEHLALSLSSSTLLDIIM
ncbi:hypothetical protein K438DRAFT_843285 [Mycena galopus ATCC 62051]|nr:hypothetical protein K438DRAFT_843285 [Mycena galopus ATCC 62051]